MRPLYAFVQSDPDINIGREKIRHLVNADDPGWTLCGRRIGYLWDWATPLAPDCGNCARSTRTPAQRGYPAGVMTNAGYVSVPEDLRELLET